MPDPKQLPYLIRLLDDDSHAVRESVLHELALFGPSLEQEIARLPAAPDAAQMQVLRGLLAQHAKTRLLDAWPTLFQLNDDKKKLEAALTLLAEFQHGQYYPSNLSSLLDALSMEYTASAAKRDPRNLSHFLFDLKQLRGAKTDYYDPSNSNLVSVIEQKRGIPISLACIYILVGNRLGLVIEGCNFPGHFLALAEGKGDTFIVDCFNAGRFLDEHDLAELHVRKEEMMQLKCDSPAIIARVLRNLIHAYDQQNDNANAQLMAELLRILEKERS